MMPAGHAITAGNSGSKNSHNTLLAYIRRRNPLSGNSDDHCRSRYRSGEQGEVDKL